MKRNVLPNIYAAVIGSEPRVPNHNNRAGGMRFNVTDEDGTTHNDVYVSRVEYGGPHGYG